MRNLKFVRAGAGSGKTYWATSEIETSLRDGSCRPSGLIATTFTRKAATELRERLRGRLYQAGMTREAEQMGQALIGTVHSIAERLLQRFALEAGISPRLEILDEDAGRVLLAESLDGVSRYEEIEQLQAIGRRLCQFDYLTWQPHWRGQVMAILDAVQANGFSTDALSVFASESIAEFLDLLGEAEDEDLSQQLADAARRALEAIEKWGDGTKVTGDYRDMLNKLLRRFEIDECAWTLWIDAATSEPARRGRPQTVIAAIENVKRLAARFPRQRRLHDDIRDYTNTLFNLATRARRRFQELKEQRGLVDFADLERRAYELLRDNPEVRKQLKDELDLLVVDEFQDTSPLQLALFVELGRCAKRMVWVGDVKQAIFGFRQSDPELIDAVVAALEDTEAQRDTLTESRRSIPPLVNLVNTWFAPAFANSLELREEDVVLQPTRSNLQAQQPALEVFSLCKGNEGDKWDQPRIDAALAAGIADLLQRSPAIRVVDRLTGEERPVRYGDIAVLCRKNDRAASVADALALHGIPASLAGPGLLSTPEAILAFACLRALADPRDVLARAQVIALTSGMPTEEWLTSRLNYVAQHDRGSQDQWGLEGELQNPRLLKLKQAREGLNAASVAEALDAALQYGDVFAAVSAWGPDDVRASQRRANLEELRVLARRYEAAAASSRMPATLSGFVAWCGALARSEGDVKAGDPSGDAVHVMTYHKAKGLEWPVVVCHQLDEDPQPRLFDVRVTTMRHGEFSLAQPLAGRHIRFWASPFGLKRSNIEALTALQQSEVGQQLQERLRGEELRLLYVGFTRARDVLVLVLNLKGKSAWLEMATAAKELLARATLPLRDGSDLTISRNVYQPSPGVPQEAAPSWKPSWFPPAEFPHTRLPAILNPSAMLADVPFRVGRKIRIGERLPIQGRPEDAVLGDALHAILAAELHHPHAPDRAEVVEGLLRAYLLDTCVNADAAARMASGFVEWVDSHFRPRSLVVECPFSYRTGDGQCVSGVIDLLLETEAGWVVMDHKTFPGAESAWDERALSHAGQLQAYAGALQATGRHCAGLWIHFCVGGGAVEVLKSPA